MKKYTFPTLLLTALLLFASCADRRATIDDTDETPNGEQNVFSENDTTDEETIPTVSEFENEPSDGDTNGEKSDESIEPVETIEDFFENAAFVGDSVMYGFDLYSNRNKTLASSSTFLTVTSFSARHALSDVGPNSYHPIYNGEKMKVEDALLLDGADKVFVSLGLNDVRVAPYSYYDNYVEFLDNIREKNPNIALFVLSTTYPVRSPHCMDTATALAYRNQLQDLNLRLKAYCDDGNAYFIDVVTPLLNQYGFLDEAYSSDDYVHLTNSAYAVWMQTIESCADTWIATGTVPSTDFPEFTETCGFPTTDDTTAEVFVPNDADETVSTETSADEVFSDTDAAFFAESETIPDSAQYSEPSDSTGVDQNIPPSQ